MKTMKKFLSMAALALVGIVMTGCSSDDNTVSTQQSNNGLVLKTTVSLDENGSDMRALTAAGVKTFAQGDQIVLFYIDGKGISRRVVSSALTAPDISADGKTANLTFDVSSAKPADNGAIRYVYPANMASTNDNSNFDLDDEHTIDFTKLDAQDGTLATLGSSLDLCVFDGNFSGTSLPASASLTNRLAVLAITLTDNAATPAEITSSITDLVVVEGTNHYAVTRSAVAGPIYVAIKPTSSAVIEVAASDGAKDYGKFLTSKTYAANNGYNVSWKMLPCVNLSTISGYYFPDGDVILTGTPAAALTIANYEGYTITLDNVNPAGTATVRMNCGSDFTLKLKGTSKFERIYDIGEALTISEAVAGGTVIINNSTGYALGAATVTVNGGTVKAKSENAVAINANLAVNGGAVYLAGADGQNAVSGTISGSATLYGYNGSAWGSITSGSTSTARYVSTDDSAAPTSWTW